MEYTPTHYGDLKMLLDMDFIKHASPKSRHMFWLKVLGLLETQRMVSELLMTKMPKK